MAASSRTSLSRVLHFAYLLQPMPIARSTEMIQTVISVAVTRRIKKQNVLATTQRLLYGNHYRDRLKMTIQI